MAHSKDLRTRVLSFINNGGCKSEASRRYKVSRSRIYVWLASEDNLSAKKTGPKEGTKISATRLSQIIKENPDRSLKELASEFGVHYSSIHYALKRMNYTRKKNMVL
jgi:putative transposase